mmetsp:Transcript_28379/g.68315  ORF Transcript_28379/g.68315 Transcript_28379/m.68315 type:complete len:219 (+) Transcript_28379:426-1082(+)
MMAPRPTFPPSTRRSLGRTPPKRQIPISFPRPCPASPRRYDGLTRRNDAPESSSEAGPSSSTARTIITSPPRWERSCRSPPSPERRRHSTTIPSRRSRCRGVPCRRPRGAYWSWYGPPLTMPRRRGTTTNVAIGAGTVPCCSRRRSTARRASCWTCSGRSCRRRARERRGPSRGRRPCSITIASTWLTSVRCWVPSTRANFVDWIRTDSIPKTERRAG